jgi:hypothetical protein
VTVIGAVRMAGTMRGRVREGNGWMGLDSALDADALRRWTIYATTPRIEFRLLAKHSMKQKPSQAHNSR